MVKAKLFVNSPFILIVQSSNFYHIYVNIFTFKMY